MFFETAFQATSLGFDYEAFSIRLNESELPHLLQRLEAVPRRQVQKGRLTVDSREMHGRCIRDSREMHGRCTGDAREMHGARGGGR